MTDRPRLQDQRIAVSGASGLVGTELCQALSHAGAKVFRLARRSAKDGEIEWRPEQGLPQADQAEGLDALVHLAGESLASGRWTPARKLRIVSSRVDATRRLVADLSTLERPPVSFLCASAVGFYGDRGVEVLTEKSLPGRGFLAELCKSWEEAALELAPTSRTAVLRFGVILSSRGGALERMLTPARLGLGGPLGTGKQYFPWITLTDCVRAICHVLEHPDHPGLRGPINLVSPADDTSRSFAKNLGRVLGRPAILPAPAAALRLALGEMADEMLLASQRVNGQALLDSGFEFLHPETQGALLQLLSD